MSKPKGFKSGKKRMDIDAFIESELSNINKTGGSKPIKLSKPVKKTKKTSIKPSFATKKINKIDPEINRSNNLENSMSVPGKPTPKRMTPFKPTKIKAKPGMNPIRLVPKEKEEKPRAPQGPSKLLEIQKKTKERRFDEPSPQVRNDKESSDDGYSDESFEKDDDKGNIMKAMGRENKKAQKFLSKHKPKINENNSFLMSNGFENKENGSSNGSSRLKLKTPEKGFSEGRKLVMNKKKVTQGAANKQHERIENLRPIIEIEFEEYDNQLNLKPQTSQDLYFNKLQTFKIHNEMIQTNEDNVERDIQTDAVEEK